MNYDLFEVGGRIRDEFLGLTSKDIDYTVVIHNINDYEDPYDSFVEHIKSEGFEVFENRKDVFTVRARFPKDHQHKGLTADFVIARKEVGYNVESRVPITEYGSLEDDLMRRDFTVNAMAKAVDGAIIDLHGGMLDLKNGILRTPTDTALSFTQDPLRVLRAVRFAVTKDLYFSDEIMSVIKVFDISRMRLVSVERVRDELFKMFKYDTKKSLDHLNLLRVLNGPLYDSLFENGLWLTPTFKK